MDKRLKDYVSFPLIFPSFLVPLFIIPSCSIQILCTLCIKPKVHKKKRPVIAFNKSDNTFVMYLYNMEQLKKLGLDSGHICECCKGKRKSYKGYIWKYADEQFAQYFGEDGIKKVEKKTLSEI